jgi:signal transduction histidine kinase
MRGTFLHSLPLIVAIVAISLLIALLVGWNLILVENYLLNSELGEDEGHWYILATGCFFFMVVIASLVLLVRFIVRDRERTRFQQVLLDSVTHELKSPLASIKLLIETMQCRELSHRETEQLQNMAVEDIQRLDDLIDHMLEAGRREQEQRAIDIEPVELEATIDRVVERVRRRRGGDFTIQISNQRCPSTFMTDQPALELILFNLLDNAIKYSNGEPRIELTLEVDDGTLSVAVRDQGVGLERSQLKRVFRRFYRATDNGKTDGVGLGLYVVNSLARSLGGRAWAESDGPGRGATFFLAIPGGTALGDPLLRRVPA